MLATGTSAIKNHNKPNDKGLFLFKFLTITDAMIKITADETSAFAHNPGYSFGTNCGGMMRTPAGLHKSRTYLANTHSIVNMCTLRFPPINPISFNDVFG